MASSLLRSCTGSLSPRTFTRCRHVAISTRRHFSAQAETVSDQNGAESNGSKPGGTTDSQTESEKQVPPSVSPEAQKLQAKEAEVVDLTARLRYLQADFLNLQRNAAREKEQTRDFAITRFATDLLEVVDVLSLALKSVPPSALPPPLSTPPPSSSETPPNTSSPSSTSDTPKSPELYLQELYTGVDMTQRLLLQTLFKYHVKPVDPLGDRFDPNKHEALYQAPVSGKEPGTVIDVQKIGYTIKDRVLRAAQVGVAQEASS